MSQITLQVQHFNHASGLLRSSNQIIRSSSFFSFSENGHIKGFYKRDYYKELSIQPLRQGHPPQIVASWFLERLSISCLMKNTHRIMSK